MKITVYAGEYVDDDSFRGEYGLGLFIDSQRHNCLFDFGNKTAENNLKALGIFPEFADVAVLSHGHCFVGGGLTAVKPRLKNAKLYARETAFEAHYFKRSRWNYKTISLPKKLTTDGIVFTKSFLKIDEELSLFSNFKPNKRESEDPRYFVDGKEFFEADTFAHEQALLVAEAGKTVLFVGAAHVGLKQMIERAEKAYQRSVSAVVGALALTDKRGKPVFGEERVRNFAFELEKSTSAEFYFASGVGDCVFGVLQEVLGARVHRLFVGETKEL